VVCGSSAKKIRHHAVLTPANRLPIVNHQSGELIPQVFHQCGFPSAGRDTGKVLEPTFELGNSSMAAFIDWALFGVAVAYTVVWAAGIVYCLVSPLVLLVPVMMFMGCLYATVVLYFSAAAMRLVSEAPSMTFSWTSAPTWSRRRLFVGVNQGNSLRP